MKLSDDLFLSEARRIGNELIDASKIDKHGVSWEFLMINMEDEAIHWRNSKNIYGGDAGVILLFIELFKSTGDKHYLEYAIKAGNRTVSTVQHEPLSFSFYNGKLGISYVLLQLYEATGDQDFIDKAKSLLTNVQDQELANTNKDILLGTSGSILGLMHLHAYTKDPKLVELIVYLLNDLVESAELGEEGVCWNTTECKKPLCGFSHGAAGIGYVLLEAAKYFDSSSLGWLAKQAFNYENFHFNTRLKNWPDFRQHVSFKNNWDYAVKNYNSLNFDYFHSGNDLVAWCHGAPGVALSRLRWHEIDKSKAVLNDVNRAVFKTRKLPANYPDFTLCHGHCGNALVVLQAYKSLPSKRSLYKHSRQIALDAISTREKLGYYRSGYPTNWEGSDRSLFMGDAGIAYFLLRLTNLKDESPTILRPDITKNFVGRKPKITMQDEGHLINSMLKKNSIKLFPQAAQRKSTYPKVISRKFVTTRLNELIKTSNGKERNNHILNKSKLNLHGSVTSKTLIFVERVVEAKRNSELLNSDIETFFKSDLVLDPWSQLHSIKSSRGDFQRKLLVADGSTIHDIDLTEFSFLVLNCFKKMIKVEQALKILTRKFSTEGVKEPFINQVRNALANGVLIQNESLVNEKSK